MKKILLFALLSVAILSMQAQTAKKQPVVAKLSKDLLVRKIKADMESTNIYPGKPYNDYTHEKGIQSLNKVPVGSSANIYSVLLEEQNCLSSNKDLNLIAFTHRKSVPLVSPENSGYIQTHFSTDGGLSWKEAKDTLADMVINQFAPAREHYNNLINNKAEIHKILKANAEKARIVAEGTMLKVRKAIGII